MKNIKPSPNQYLRVVAPDEVLKESFLIRDIVRIYSIYRNDDWDERSWHTVKDDIPYFIGKTYNEYCKCMGTKPQHEIVELLEPNFSCKNN